MKKILLILISWIVVCSWEISGVAADEATDQTVSPQPFSQEQWARIENGDAQGLAHVRGYSYSRSTGKYSWPTNEAVNWWGERIEDANHWLVNLRLHYTNTPDATLTVHVGSLVTNSGPGLLHTPDRRYAALELLDSDGKRIPTRQGAAAKLYQSAYTSTSNSWEQIVNKHPLPDDAPMTRNYPGKISDLEYPRWESGRFTDFVGFVSNGPPCHIGYLKFNDVFSVEKEGDYTLMVQPVLFRMHTEGGTFQGYLDRVDLPSVTTKVRLIPNAK